MRNELKSPKTYFTEDSRVTKFYFELFCISEIGCAVLSTVGIVYSIIAVKINNQ